MYTQYGVYVTEGGYNSLIGFPALKEVEKNDWQEIDGVEVDLSAPVLNAHEVEIKFACSGGDIQGFVSYLQTGWLTCVFAEISRTYVLRYISVSNFKYYADLVTATIKFSDDFPLRNYTYTAPQSTIPENDDYKLDGDYLTDWGVRVLQGSLAEILKPAQVKPNLSRDIQSVAGVEYTATPVTLKSRNVKLQCLLRAATLTELWRNWDALLYDLIRPDARELYVKALDETYDCYYKQCSVQNFCPDGKIWLQFTLTLEFIN